MMFKDLKKKVIPETIQILSVSRKKKIPEEKHRHSERVRKLLEETKDITSTIDTP